MLKFRNISVEVTEVCTNFQLGTPQSDLLLKQATKFLFIYFGKDKWLIMKIFKYSASE